MSSSPFKKRIKPYGFLLPASVIILPILAVIVVRAIILITHNENLTNPSARSWVGFGNIAKAFSDSDLRDAILVTIEFVVGTTIVELIIGLVLSFLLAGRIRGRGVVRTLILAPMVLAPVVAGLMWRLLLDPSFGFVNYLLSKIGIGHIAFLSSTKWALLAVGAVEVWQFIPYVMTICVAALESLDDSVIESAIVEGASGWRMVRNIKLPMIWPAVAITLLLRAIDAVKGFALMSSMTDGGPGTATTTIGVYVYRVAFKRFDVGYATTVGVVTSVVVMVIVWPAAHRLMRSINR